MCANYQQLEVTGTEQLHRIVMHVQHAQELWLELKTAADLQAAFDSLPAGKFLVVDYYASKLILSTGIQRQSGAEYSEQLAKQLSTNSSAVSHLSQLIPSAMLCSPRYTVLCTVCTAILPHL